MEDQAQSRVESAVPKPDAQHLSEAEKRALELQGEIEHAHGEAREEKTKQAERLGK